MSLAGNLPSLGLLRKSSWYGYFAVRLPKAEVAEKSFWPVGAKYTAQIAGTGHWGSILCCGSGAVEELTRTRKEKPFSSYVFSILLSVDKD